MICNSQIKLLLPCNENATQISTDQNGKQYLSLYYPQSAFALKMRAYISSVISFLKRRMDVQFSDQCGMLMRYVANYVSKFKDSQTTESLYSTHLVPAQAAYRHLRDVKPCEPEMMMTLLSTKMAWCNNSTKSYVPPTSSSAASNTVLQKYYQRNNECNVSFLEYLRTHDTGKANPPLNKCHRCLVGIKYLSYFNTEFLFQFLLMNLPHCNLDELKHPSHDTLPDDLKYFASCVVKLPEMFTPGHICYMLQKEGHKTYFINNVMNFFENLRNVYHLWQIQVLQKQ